MTQRSAPRLLALIFAIAFVTGPISRGATFQWTNTTGNWSVATNWMGTAAPTGGDATDVLTFGGDVSAAYTSTNGLAAIPSLINQLVLNATDPLAVGTTHFITGGAIAFGGAAPQISQNGAGGLAINAPIELRAPLTLTGNGGTVTLNNTVSGLFDITKTGTSAFRFGTPFTDPIVGPSANTWVGRLMINEGTIRFNNNAEAGRTALRANPIILNGATAVLTVSSELRTGTLSGASGLVESRVTGNDTANENIVITALGDGVYSGTIRLAPGTGIGDSNGTLIVRGVGKQTFTGAFVSPDSPLGSNALQITKDVAIGRGATLSLSGNASLAQQTSNAAIIMNGGTFQLDNSTTALNRLRDGAPTNTGLDTVGGGLFSLIGNALGINELVARLQLGSASNPRSGPLTLHVQHNAGAAAATQLSIQSISRDGTAATFATLDFAATDSNGTELALGQAGANPRISFLSAPPLSNGLFRNTVLGANESTVGWATVNGSAFATHGANGVAAVGLNALPGASTPGNPTFNVEVTGNFTATNGGGYSLNSLRLAPTGEGQSFAIDTAGNLKTNAILLAGSRDYTISGSGAIGTASVGPTAAAARYIHVESATLTVSASVNGAFLPLVKAGEGTLSLTNTGNVSMTTPTVINAGTLRATPGTSLPGGEIRLRGGVLEISNATATFTRQIGRGAGSLNWSGLDDLNAPLPEDRGSGGFAAIGADVTVDLNAAGASNLAWEDNGFVNSGHSLLFGSRHSDRRVTWVDNVQLTATIGASNYNAREIRVADNPLVTTDAARVSGVIAGSVQNDLLKTGAGLLELTGANTYAGATIVHEGILAVNRPGTSSQSFLHEVRSGATLAGNGTVGNVRVLAGGRLAPGANVTDAGTLSTRNIAFEGASSKFSIELGGTTPDTGHDQVAATGTVSLDGAELAGSLINGFAPAINDIFFVIINDGVDAVGGAFAQGNFALIGNVVFEIHYAGDSATSSLSGGNDVVLQAVPEPGAGLLAMLAVAGWGARRQARSGRK